MLSSHQSKTHRWHLIHQLVTLPQWIPTQKQTKTDYIACGTPYILQDAHKSIDHTLISSSTSSNQNSLKLIIVNCQSIFAKKPTFEHLLYQHNPDFIAGSESWLTQSINTNEIFPPTYTIYRRDRPDGYGGVFLGCKFTFISEEIPLKTLCEIVACRIHLRNNSLILLSVYRPPNKDYAYLEEFCSIISSIILSNPNNIIWLAGDVNFPNIDWHTYYVKGNS